MARISPKLIGHLAHYGTHALSKTLKMQIQQHPSVDIGQPYIYCFWHNMHFTPVMFAGSKLNRVAGLVSPSKDGEILATWLKHLGYKVIRGSSSRRGINGVVKLIHAIKDGYSVGIALDGPRGPIYEAKAGAAFIAAKTGVPLIPLGAAYSRRYEFEKSWDKFQMPLPFSKVAVALGEPIFVKEGDDINSVNQQLKKAIHEAQHQAQSMQGIINPKVPA